MEDILLKVICGLGGLTCLVCLAITVKEIVKLSIYFIFKS